MLHGFCINLIVVGSLVKNGNFESREETREKLEKNRDISEILGKFKYIYILRYFSLVTVIFIFNIKIHT